MTDRLTDRQIYQQTELQTNRRTNRKMARKADVQKDRHTEEKQTDDTDTKRHRKTFRFRNKNVLRTSKRHNLSYFFVV
jgi:hypothetical protein